MSAARLTATGIGVAYGAVTAVDRFDITVQQGQLVGLIGPNGAGKTSFIDAICGFTPSSGTLCVDGRDVSRMSPHRRARLGLRRTWQSLELFDDLTVRENVQVSLDRSRPHGFGRASSTSRDRAERIAQTLATLGLEQVSDRRPSELPLGQRKMLGVARALVAQPSIVAMDEPAAGLDSAESKQLGVTLRRLVEDGLAVLLVDHDMNLVLSVCDYIYVMDFGRLIAEGEARSISRNPAVMAAYLGLDPEREPALVDEAAGRES